MVVGLTDQLDLLADYYKKSTARQMSAERRQFLTTVLDSGLTPAQVMDAIDKAVVRFGLTGREIDYWESIRNELRRVYREMRKEGLVE